MHKAESNAHSVLWVCLYVLSTLILWINKAVVYLWKNKEVPTPLPFDRLNVTVGFCQSSVLHEELTRLLL